MAQPGRVVVVSAREDLRTAVTRLTALAGVEVETVASSVEVRGLWRAARIVVVGVDLVAVVAAAGLPRRPEVVVVADAEPDARGWRAAVELGATRVLALPADDRELVELISAAFEVDTAAGSTIAVIGGCGGAGASTFAAGLAVSCARSAPSVLIDGDRLGGGIDVLLGAEQRPGARWSDLASTRGRLGAADLAGALVDVNGLAVLSWDRDGSQAVSPEAATAVMAAAARAFRWVIVDLPRPLGETGAVLAGTADLVVMVVPATVRATAAASTVTSQVRSQCAQLGLVVRDAGSGRLRAAEVAAALGLTVTASFQSESAVVLAADRGEPPLRRTRGSLHDACRAVVSGLAGEPVAA